MATVAKSTTLERILLYAFLLVLAFVSLVPFLWALSSSLKSEAETFDRPYAWLPESWQWSNYAYIFERAPLARHFLTLSVKLAQKRMALTTLRSPCSKRSRILLWNFSVGSLRSSR